MKLSHDESRALGFIGLLLALSAGARLVDRPKAIPIDAPGVDVAALESASRDLMRESGAKASRPKKPSQAKTSSGTARPPAKPKGEPAEPRTTAKPPKSTVGPATAPIRLNGATAKDLEGLPGVGPVLAARIIAYRDSVGGIRTFEQLDEVKGIGPAMLARLKPLLDLGT